MIFYKFLRIIKLGNILLTTSYQNITNSIQYNKREKSVTIGVKKRRPKSVNNFGLPN